MAAEEMSKSHEQNSELFLIEGHLTELLVERGTQNLLEKLDKHYKGKAVLSGAASSAANLYGNVASSAMVAMYDGEETENFIGQINGEVICGQFAGASSLPDGKAIKAVVRREGDVLQCTAVIDEERGFLWINHAYGSRAELMANLKLGFWLWVFSMFILFATWLAMGMTVEKLTTLAIIAIGTFGGIIILSIWNSSTLNALADPTTRAFELFGFADPSRVSLRRYLVSLLAYDELLQARRAKKKAKASEFFDLPSYAKNDLYNYRRAIQDGHIRLKTPTS